MARTLERRLLDGGLPQATLATTKDPGFYREWIDSFFARDIRRFRDINRFTAGHLVQVAALHTSPW